MTLEELKGVLVHVVKDNFCNLNGRANRYEFWWFFVINLILGAIASIGDAIIGWPSVLSCLLSLILLLPQLGLDVRRLHDINRSGWWLLLFLIPVLGWIILLVWAIQKSDEGANDFGEPSNFPGEAPQE